VTKLEELDFDMEDNEYYEAGGRAGGGGRGRKKAKLEIKSEEGEKK
jgi:hypothetical protein